MHVHFRIDMLFDCSVAFRPRGASRDTRRYDKEKEKFTLFSFLHRKSRLCVDIVLGGECHCTCC